MTTDFSIATHFDDAKARGYDDNIRRVLPGYQVLHDLATLVLGQEVPADAEVLAVGAGTGNELMAFGAAHPGWRLTAVDPAAPMLAAARRRVAEASFADRVRFVHGTAADLPGNARFDGASAILVSHFLPDDGAKLELFRAIGQRLKPGAPLVLANVAAAADDGAHRRTIGLWRKWCLTRGKPAVEVDDMFAHVDRDLHLVPESRVVELLRAAGFTETMPFYQALAYTGMVAWMARP